MKRIWWFLVLLPILAHAASYTVTFDASTPLVTHIEADLPAGSAALHMASWGGDPFPNGWASRVRNLVVTSDGTPVAATLTPKAAKWTVASEAPLHLAYDVDLSFAKEKWPYGNEQAGYYDNSALFVVSKALFIVSDAAGSHSVAIEAPKSWTVVTAWESIGGGRFRVDDTNELINNSVVVGRFAHHTFHTGNFEVTVALLGEMHRAEPVVTDALQRVLTNYGRIFPETPRSRYLMTLFLSDDIDAEAFSHSAAFSEREMPSRANLIGWGDTLAHETFHSWNGAGLAPRDYPSSQWFSEGFTEYFANLALVQERLIPQPLFLSKAEKNLGLYALFRSSPAFNDVTLADAGKNKGRNRIGVYDGGWAVAFCLDIDIRMATENRRNLADFMRLLYRRFGLTKTPYTLDDVAAAASDIAGRDMRPFFTKYVSGTELLPITEALGKAGLASTTKLYDGEIYIRRDGQNRAQWPVKPAATSTRK